MGRVHLFSFPEFQVSGLIWQETLELVAKKKNKKLEQLCDWPLIRERRHDRRSAARRDWKPGDQRGTFIRRLSIPSLLLLTPPAALSCV